MEMVDVKYEHVIQDIGDMIIKKEKKKREPHKLVIINEEELIRQVELRPMLYDKSLKGYRKSALRDQCWKEIAASVNSTVEECRKRWRSLRDAFAKHYKQLSDVSMSSKKKKWIFYDQMYFIAPYLDCTNSSQESSHISQLQDNSHESLILNDEDGHLEEAIEETSEFKSHHHHHHIQQNTTVPSSTVTTVEQVNIDNLHHHHHHSHHHHHQGNENLVTGNEATETNGNDNGATTTTTTHISAIDLNDENQFVARIFTSATTPSVDYDTTAAITTTATGAGIARVVNANNNSLKQKHQQTTTVCDPIAIERCDEYITGGTPITATATSASIATISSITDPDERFLLSCAPIMKRLSNKKNALARLKIQQILYDIEFDE